MFKSQLYILYLTNIMILCYFKYPTYTKFQCTSFLVAVTADIIACHYIIKWLNDDYKDNE